MPDSIFEQIDRLTQFITDLQTQQRAGSVDLSIPIASLQVAVERLRAEASAASAVTSGGVEMQSDTSTIGGDVVGRDKSEIGRHNVNAQQNIEMQINIPAQPAGMGERRGSVAGKIYESTLSDKFLPTFEHFLQTAKHITMIGIGFSALSQNDPLFEKLSNRVKDDCEIEICAANPYSPNVQMRLIEEETGSRKPQIGMRGLIEWLDELLTLKKELSHPERLDVRLFPFYPTYALYIFDRKEYIFYPYGYAQLGTFSPTIHYSSANPDDGIMVDFLRKQYHLVKSRSTAAELIFDLRANKKIDLNQLKAFAVYLIPSDDSKLYRLGSEILEYNVRTGEVYKPGKWHNAIGAAAEFGFHLTVADALYCTGSSDLDLISEEVRFVSREFHPFTLRLEIKKNFPNEKGIALECTEEKTGVLEALHHEMVARVYRKAVASNYSLGLAPRDRDSDTKRADLMVDHYHAPYILQRFKPHFSLLSNVPAGKKEQMLQDLAQLFDKCVPTHEIEISSIAVMYIPVSSGCWRIFKEYQLGGKS